MKVFQKFNSQFCRVTTRTLLSSTLTSGITAKISGRNVSNITASSGVWMCPPPSGRSRKSSAEDPHSGMNIVNSAVTLSIGSTTSCTITEKAPTSAFTFKTLLRHYAKRALTPRSLNVKLGSRRNYHERRAAIRHYANQSARPL